MVKLIEITETDTEYIVKGNPKLIKDFKTNKNLIVKGNILGDDKGRYNFRALDIDAQNIYARDIDARDIIFTKKELKDIQVQIQQREFL